MYSLAINMLKLTFFALLLIISACSTNQIAASNPSSAPDNQPGYNAIQVELNQAISHHQSLLKLIPDNTESLSTLAQLHTLKGAYLHSRNDKRRAFSQAMLYAEKIMLQNPEFSARINNGDTIWAAAEVLSNAESDGLGWWSTAMLYYYREGLPSWRQLFSYKRVIHAKALMDQLGSVNPNWEYGTNFFNLAIYYHALPEVAGGDKKISAMYMAKAENAGPDRLLIPWGKAKYFYDKSSNNDSYMKSIEWVASQDVEHDNGEHYLWRIYFKTQAIDMLAAY